MLQWMGGSRRKVTTSRRSTQKRQKQYFEQRRRKQHQQAAGLDSFEEGDNIRGENCGENHRSLDVLSLQNWSTIAKDSTPTFHPGREDPKVNASTVNSLIFKDPPLIRANPVGPLLSPEIKETRTLSGYQPETVSPKKVLFSSSNNRSKAFSGTNNKLDPCKMTTQQSSSVFDLLADDEPNEKSDGSPAREAHVAFSVEGLGKMGSETPPYTPRQPGRYVSYGHPSPLKASRQRSSSKNLDYSLNDLEVEVDAIMQHVDMPLRGHPSEFSMEIEDSYCKLKNNLSSITDSVHLDDHGRMRSSFNEKKTFGETENNDDKWGATCRSRDASFLDKRESDISWNSWPYSMNGNSAEFLKYGNDRLPDYAFEGCHPPKKRDSMNAKEVFNILDSPYLKHQTSETDFDFMISERAARKPSPRMNFGFGDTTIQPDWSCFITEDARDNQSLLSEESSSSTAVRDKVTDISPSNSRARRSRRHQNASGYNSCTTKSIFLKGRQFKNGEEIQKGNNVYGSGKSTQIPMLSDSRSAHNLDWPFQEKIGSSRGWMFKEGYGSADMNTGFSSPCQTSEKKHPLSGSKPWTEDIFDAFVPEPQIDARLSFDTTTTKHGGSVKRSPTVSFVCEKFTLCQKSSSMHTHDSPTFSKVEFGATKPDFTFDSPDFEFEGNPSDPSEDAASHGGKLVLELSAKESVRKDKKNRSKFQQTNYEKVETWNSPVGNSMKPMDAFLCQKSSSMHAHDSPTFSKVEFGATKPDFTFDSPDFEFEGNPSDPSEDAASHGGKLVLELSAKESVRKDKKNRSKFQQTNYEKVETWNSPVGNSMKPMDAFLCQKSSSMHAHDSPTFSKVEFGATKPDFTLDSPDFEFEGNPSDPSEDAASHGEKLVLELSAKESVRKDKKNRSKFQQTNYEKVETWNSPVGNNMKPMDALEYVDNDPERKDARDEPLETSSSVKIPNKSESSVDKKEYHHDAEVYPPCPMGNKEAENEGPGVRKISRDGNHPDSSPPVMMLKSYVLQLLCMQKAPKEASVQTA